MCFKFILSRCGAFWVRLKVLDQASPGGRGGSGGVCQCGQSSCNGSLKLHVTGMGPDMPIILTKNYLDKIQKMIFYIKNSLISQILSFFSGVICFLYNGLTDNTRIIFSIV